MSKVSWLLCISTIAVAIGGGIHLTSHAQNSMQVFIDSGAALPATTRFFLSASDSWLIYVGPLLAIITILKEITLADERLRLKANLGLLFGVGIFFGVGYWSMTLPHTGPII